MNETTTVNTAYDATNAARRAVATFGPRFSEPLSRLELLSWQPSAYRASSTTNSIHPVLPIGAIILHCYDTLPNQRNTIEMLCSDHSSCCFEAYPSYHFYITRDGTLNYCRPLHIKSCHVKGHDTGSIGLYYKGGRCRRKSLSPLPGVSVVSREEAGKLSCLGIAINQNYATREPARASPEKDDTPNPMRA